MVCWATLRRPQYDFVGSASASFVISCGFRGKGNGRGVRHRGVGRGLREVFRKDARTVEEQQRSEHAADWTLLPFAAIPLPAGVTADIDIPAIGFVIPDLEATAFVRLIKVSDGTEAACLKVDLSNGLSTRIKGVSWALGGLAIGSLLVGVLGGIVVLAQRGEVEKGRSKERFVGMLAFFQFVATTGLLSLDYPLVFTAFTANFAWCIGLIYVRPIQVGIDNLRERTGGNLTQIAGTIVGGTRALSSNSRVQSNFARLSSSSSSIPPPDFPTTLVHHLATQITSTASRLTKRALEIPAVQTTSFDELSTGIPRYATRVSISPFNAYMTVFVTFLLLLCFFLAVVLLLSIPFVIVARRAAKRNGKENVSLRQGYSYSLLRANALRLVSLSCRACEGTGVDEAFIPAPRCVVPSPHIHLLSMDPRPDRCASFPSPHGMATDLSALAVLGSHPPLSPHHPHHHLRHHIPLLPHHPPRPSRRPQLAPRVRRRPDSPFLERVQADSLVVLPRHSHRDLRSSVVHLLRKGASVAPLVESSTDV